MFVYSCFIFSGAGFQFLYVSLTYWWMFAIVNMWWIITFPNRAKQFMANARKIHALQSIVAWGVPLVLITAVVANDGFAYSPFNLKFCTGSNTSWIYFTFALPQQINSAIGISLLILTCYRLRRKVRFQSLRYCVGFMPWCACAVEIR